LTGSKAQGWLVRPADDVRGTIRVPGDKSISHRALMLGAIADGPSTIRGFLAGEDCIATMTAMRKLGVEIQTGADSIVVNGVGMRGLRAPEGPLDLGNSGTAIRLLAGLLAPQAFDTALTGDASLRRRPMQRVAEPLIAMGASIATTNGCPPIRITGGRSLHGIDYNLPVASAQVKSAILLAGLYAEGETIVRSPAPTRDHTERMLEAMGAPMRIDLEASSATVRPAERLVPVDLDVPGDFSSAAFFIVAASIGAEDGMLIENVGLNPTRTGLLEILSLMGADIEVRNRRVDGTERVADLFVRKAQLHGIEVPRELVALSIDEFPALFVAAAAGIGTTRVSGASELRYKESDRIAVMATALRNLGIRVEEFADGMCVEGGKLRGGRIDSHGDHRVAMAMAVASLLSSGPIEVLDTEPVATSFPNFAELAARVGLTLEALQRKAG